MLGITLIRIYAEFIKPTDVIEATELIAFIELVELDSVEIMRIFA